MSAIVARLAAAGVPLPVRASDDPDEIGVIIDAGGRDFATIDVNGERVEAEVSAIALAVAEAINLAAREIAPASLAAEVAAEATAAVSRRATARSTGTVNKPLAAARTPTEQVVSLMVETPGDLVALVRRQWPELWARVLALARVRGVSPVAQLVEAISAGVKMDGRGQ